MRLRRMQEWSRPDFGTVLLLLSGFLLPNIPTSIRAQVTLPDTAQGDSIRPLLLPGIQIRILRTPLALEASPLSVSVLGQEELTLGRAGIGLEEALQGLPGVQIQNRYNYSVGERIVLRGVGARTQFGVRGIRVLLDGIPATLPDGQSTLDHLDLFSLGGIEVLRGPGASLYGNGAGAVIRFRTRAPPSGPNRSEAQLVAGTFGLRRLSVLSEGTSGETGYLVSGSRLAFDGFRGDPVKGRGTYGLVRRWNGNGRVSRALVGGAFHLTVNVFSQDSENPGSLSRALMAEDRTQAYAFNVRQGTGEQASQAVVGVTWERRWDRWETELAAHGIRREVLNPIPPTIVDLSRGAGGVRALLRGRWPLPLPGSGESMWEWTFGGETEGQWDHRRNLENLEGEPGAVTLNQEERVFAWGGFAQTRVHWAGTLDLLAGLRYDHIGFRVRDRLAEGTNPDDSGSRWMDGWSPSVGMNVRLGERLRLRGSASTFFQTPTTSELANQPTGAGGFNPSLEPQRGWSSEIGLRIGGRGPVQLEGTLFQTRTTHELVPYEVPGAPGRTFYRNAGRSRTRGVEVAAFAAIPGEIHLRGAYTLSDTRFDRFVVDGEVFDGNRVPGVAPHRFEVVGRWTGGDDQGVGHPYVETRVLYQGGTPVDDGNTDRAAPFAVLDLRAGMDSLPLGGTRWSVFGGVTNLLDREYTASVAVNAFGRRFFEPGPGRSVFVGIRATLFPFGETGSTLIP